MTIIAKLFTRPGHVTINEDLTVDREETNIVDTIPAAPELGLYLELRLTDPRSLEGRRAVLVIPPEQLEGVLKAVRETMIALRQKTMTPMTTTTSKEGSVK